MHKPRRRVPTNNSLYRRGLIDEPPHNFNNYRILKAPQVLMSQRLENNTVDLDEFVDENGDLRELDF